MAKKIRLNQTLVDTSTIAVSPNIAVTANPRIT